MHKVPEDLLGLLCQHMVALSWLDIANPPYIGENALDCAKPEAFAVSGFVLSIRGVWVLVTAGHIVEQMTLRFKDGRRLVKARLMDCFSSEGRFPGIPFDLQLDRVMFIDDDETGMDFALIYLSPSYVAQLRAGGVVPLDEIAWQNPPANADLHVLIGLPAQAKKIQIQVVDGGGLVTFETGVPLLPVYATHEPPECLQKEAERFYAHVPIGESTYRGKRLTLTDIDGMSGGPIFALKQDDAGNWHYWVIAVQSSWAPESRVLAAPFIEDLANSVASAIDKFAQEAAA